MDIEASLDEAAELICGGKLTGAQIYRLHVGAARISRSRETGKLEFASGPPQEGDLGLPLAPEICFATSKPRPLNANDMMVALTLIGYNEKARVLLDAFHLRQDPTTNQISYVEGSGRGDPNALEVPLAVKCAMLEDPELVTKLAESLISEMSLYPEAWESMLNGIRRDRGQEEVVGADREKGEYKGIVDHVHRGVIYMKDPKFNKTVTHDSKHLDSAPKVGQVVSIKYKEGRAKVELAKNLAAGALSR